MLMEKTGYAEFSIVDENSGQKFIVDNSEFLTPFQEKEMASQTSLGWNNIEDWLKNIEALRNALRSSEELDCSANSNCSPRCKG